MELTATSKRTPTPSEAGYSQRLPFKESIDMLRVGLKLWDVPSLALPENATCFSAEISDYFGD